MLCFDGPERVKAETDGAAAVGAIFRFWMDRWVGWCFVGDRVVFYERACFLVTVVVVGKVGRWF